MAVTISQEENYDSTLLENSVLLRNYSDDAFKVLEYINDNSFENHGVIEFSGNQAKIAKALGHSKATVNRLIKKLQDDRLVRISNKTRGKYQITDKGRELIEKMNKSF
jgi:DNA-binding MarR family transcriptional regulator